MQQEQLTKIATLMDAIQAVTTDPKIPISKVILVQGGSANNALASALDETTTPGKKKREASPEELDAIGEQVRELGLACSVAY